jgi:hypothetical protein
MTAGIRYIVLLFFALLAFYTSTKLIKMCAVKGWIPGARVEPHTITQKMQETGRYGEVYWISWTARDIHEVGNHRTNLDPNQWTALKIGDPIDIIYYRSDPSPYVRQDIFVSAGNFAFDSCLLAAESFAVAAMLWLVLKRRRRA